MASCQTSESIIGTLVSFPAAVMRVMPMANRMGETAHPYLFSVLPLCGLICGFKLKLDPAQVAGDHSLDVIWDKVMLQSFFDALMGNRCISVGKIFGLASWIISLENSCVF